MWCKSLTRGIENLLSSLILKHIKLFQLRHVCTSNIAYFIVYTKQVIQKSRFQSIVATKIIYFVCNLGKQFSSMC